MLVKILLEQRVVVGLDNASSRIRLVSPEGPTRTPRLKSKASWDAHTSSTIQDAVRRRAGGVADDAFWLLGTR
jgi:hypothetical protein